MQDECSYFSASVSRHRDQIGIGIEGVDVLWINIDNEAMENKKRALLALVASTVVLAFGVGVLVWCPREPTYQGRHLSDWVIQFGPGRNPSGQRKEAEVALGKIGTNALPYLLRWLRYEPPQWRAAVKRFVAMCGPQFLLEHFYERPGRRSLGAVFCLTLHPLLIPEIEVMAKDRGHPNTASTAVEMLFSIGEQSLPGFEVVLVNQTQSNRVRVAEMVGLLPRVSAAAAQWLEKIKLGEMTNGVPRQGGGALQPLSSMSGGPKVKKHRLVLL